MKISVAIPTYKRPEYVRQAIASVVRQTHKPYELILVSRSSDYETKEAIMECVHQYDGVNIKHVFVDVAGFLPPVVKAIDTAGGDILAFLDDDAEAHPDWLSRISKYYLTPSVAGVGGRYINFLNGIKQQVSPCSVAAKLFWYGKSVGNMHRDTLFSQPRNADFLIGGNMSFRLSLLKEAKPDWRLGKNVSFYWEMDVGLKIKKMGYRIIFDPQIAVDHHSAPRELDGLRTINYEGVYWSNYNYALLMRTHLSKFGYLAYIAYSLLVGWGGSPGLIYILIKTIQGKRFAWTDEVCSSYAGRLKAILDC